jgi:hypothetical protein
MTTERITEIEALLDAAKEAHGAYERDELDGVYDEDWPAWYARFAVEHGIGDILGRPVTAEELGAYLTRTWDEIRQSDPKPTEPWATIMARRIATEM